MKNNICFISFGADFGISAAMEAADAGIQAAFNAAQKNKQFKKATDSMLKNATNTNMWDLNAFNPNDPNAMLNQIQGMNTITTTDDVINGSGVNSFFIGGLITQGAQMAQQKRLEKKAAEMAPQITQMQESAKQMAILNTMNTIDNMNTRKALNAGATYANDGGFLAKSPFNVFNGGYHHEDIIPFGNQDRGIAQGYSNDGQLNVVEKDEVIDRDNNYVISNSKETISKEYGGWLITKEDIIKYDLPTWAIGKSLAETAKRIIKFSEDRNNTDPIANRTTRAMMDRVESLNEEKRTMQQAKESLESSKEEYRQFVNAIKTQKFDINEILAKQEEQENQQMIAEQQSQQQDIQNQNTKQPILEQPQYSEFGGFADNKNTFTEEGIEALGLPSELVGQDIDDVIASIPQTQENIETINKLMSLKRKKKTPITLNIPNTSDETSNEYTPGGVLKTRRKAGIGFKDMRKNGLRKDFKKYLKNTDDVAWSNEADSRGRAYFKESHLDQNTWEDNEIINRFIDAAYSKADDFKGREGLMITKDGVVSAEVDANGNPTERGKRDLMDYQAMLNARNQAEINRKNMILEGISGIAGLSFPIAAMAMNNKNFGEYDVNRLQNLVSPPSSLQYSPVGQYVKSNPTPFNYMSNKLRQQSNSVKEGLSNINNMSPGAYNAAVLALNKDTQEKIADLDIKSVLANNEAMHKDAAFNYTIDANNAKNKMQVDMANLDAMLKYQSMLSNNEQRAGLLQNAQALQKREDLFSNLGVLGNTINNMTSGIMSPILANRNPYSDFLVSGQKKDNTTNSKYGGRIKSKKKKI